MALGRALLSSAVTAAFLVRHHRQRLHTAAPSAAYGPPVVRLRLMTSPSDGAADAQRQQHEMLLALAAKQEQEDEDEKQMGVAPPSIEPSSSSSPSPAEAPSPAEDPPATSVAAMTEKELRKLRKKEAKAHKRARRAGEILNLKPCDLCKRDRDLLVRCQIDETLKWFMVCGRCWKSVSGGVVDGDAAHPHYRYGGLWKAH